MLSPPPPRPRRGTDDDDEEEVEARNEDMLPSAIVAPPTGDPELPYEAPEEYLNYIANRFNDRRVVHSLAKGQRIEERIDAIPPAPVACADWKKLREAHQRNRLGTFKAVSRGFDILERRQDVDPSLLVTPAEAEYLRERRRLGCLPKPVAPIVAAGLTHLAEKSKLGMKFSNAQVGQPDFGNGNPLGQRFPTAQAGGDDGGYRFWQAA